MSDEYGMFTHIPLTRTGEIAACYDAFYFGLTDIRISLGTMRFGFGFCDCSLKLVEFMGDQRREAHVCSDHAMEWLGFADTTTGV